MTAKTKSERFRRLISHGFFAPELPPCFVSEDLAKYRQSVWKAINLIPPKKKGGSPPIQKYVSEPCSFYFPRYGRDDRKHGVINPVSYLAIAHTVSENFVALRNAAKKSKLSASPPVFDWTGERAVLRPSIDMRDDFRVDLSSRVEEYSVADIRAFFHSIYTHAIPWAIHGKKWAKKNRSLANFGNLLDLYCRNAQDGQTIGLPVGPDTSRLIAEVIASAVDEQLRTTLKISGQDASRYVDDYTVGSIEGVSGTASIAALRQAVSTFELELNNDKSEVVPTSVRQGSGWKQAIRAHIPRGNYNHDSFQRFFYEVGRVCSEQPDINIEKFAYQNARSAFVSADDWKKVQSALISAYRRNPSLVSFLAEILILREIKHNDVNKISLKVFLEARLPTLAQENRTGEIVWLLFLTLRLEIALEARKISPLFEIENGLVAILVNVADSRGLISGKVDYSLWRTSMHGDALYGPMWLYAYQSSMLGIGPIKKTTYIENDAFFAPILAKNISFLDIDAGFTSIDTVLRSRRSENQRIKTLRLDFMEDFDFETEEFDDEDFEFDEEVNLY
ncbi:RNA-directed DNA polymerase [uncultured Roseobacter sp.]|uniref:RNA-directed DNA polymerase n=1 Tax=uncultured Roseobacter sp. TaxID=114847 RepID=UPI00262C8C78|nr:RNA-directed DNA polymerase [uncultured Roseobacter sp.]